MDIKFLHMGGPGGQAWGIIHSENWKNHKNSTNYKIKFYIIFIDLFFYDGYLNFSKEGS